MTNAPVSVTPRPALRDTLDERQRGMLQAMGIELFWPEPAPERHPADSNTVPALANAGSVAIKSIASTAPEAAPAPVTSALVVPSAPSALSPALSDGVELDWLSLHSAVSACRACKLCESRKNTVFGVGPAPAQPEHPPQVDWLIVGEAPGENEDAQGEPFVGQAGKLLDNMLAAMKVGTSAEGKPLGLSRQSSVYIANVLKCRPPANRNPSPEEVAMCEPYLARQIELLRPKIILAMGKFAISSLTGSSEPVGKLRGRVHALQHPRYQAPVIVTYHPAYLLRNLPDKAKAWADLLLAMQTYSSLRAA